MSKPVAIDRLYKSHHSSDGHLITLQLELMLAIQIFLLTFLIGKSTYILQNSLFSLGFDGWPTAILKLGGVDIPLILTEISNLSSSKRGISR